LREQHTGDSNTKNTWMQSKHENRWVLKKLKSIMERKDRGKSNRRKPDMGLDVVL